MALVVLLVPSAGTSAALGPASPRLATGEQAASGASPYPPCVTESYQDLPRCGAAELGYDYADGYVVAYMICLYGATVYDSCTWKYSNGSWTNVTPVTGPNPPPLLPTRLVWDPVSQSLLLFGGYPYNWPGTWANLWSYRAGVWTNLTSSVPGALASSSFDGAVLDSADACILVLWKTVHMLAQFTATWTYWDGTWTNITNRSPTANSIPVAPYGADDPSDHGAVFFGGVNSTGTSNATWLFSGGTWRPLSPRVSPPLRVLFSMAYDSLDDYVLMVGGTRAYCASDCPLFGDEWTFAHGQWTNITSHLRGDPPLEVGGLLVSDLADREVLEGFGSAGTNFDSPPQSDLFAYRNGTWYSISPPSAGPFWADPAFLILMGGVAVGAAIGCGLWVRRRSV